MFQGLACHRYFARAATARRRAALQVAARGARGRVPVRADALDGSQGARSCSFGHLHAGTALLEQARTHAERVGFELNAHAIACSIAIYRAKFKLGPEVVSDLEALLRLRRQHDSYSERMVRTALAIQYALRGRASDAVRELERADADALRVDARRAKVATLIARLQLTRLREGARACAAILDDVAALTQKGDVAYRSELLSMGIKSPAPSGTTPASRGRWTRCARSSALRALGDDRARPPRIDRTLSAIRTTPTVLRGGRDLADAHGGRRRRRPVRACSRSACSGPSPRCSASRRAGAVMFLARENVALVGDHGDLFARASPPVGHALLRVLSGGASRRR
ncbi:MAG: hypothetical protein U0414_06585 [Polyangiaceae bacterium]